MRIVFLAFVVLCLASCGEKPYTETYMSFDDHTWRADVPLVSKFDVQDTTKFYDFLFTLRHGQDYAYSNLFIFVEVSFPNGRSLIDTLECVLADQSGRWLGNGIGDLVDHRILLNEKRMFPIKGPYELTITQAMRDSELKGVYDVGFSLENTK
ncbi:MAG: gliding motility lipoprotein GldH [Flavobacteriales bacterium]|jgi:gliding motility-associated lipoprotein GldH|nr:gliding motility lipoprotein GldH [Flavobacteriales bacterium]